MSESHENKWDDGFIAGHKDGAETAARQYGAELGRQVPMAFDIESVVFGLRDSFARRLEQRRREFEIGRSSWPQLVDKDNEA